MKKLVKVVLRTLLIACILVSAMQVYAAEDYKKVLEAEFEPDSDGLSKRPDYGEITENGWRFDISEEVQPENVIYGPRLEGAPVGELYAYLVIKADSLDGLEGRIVNYDIYDANADAVVGERSINVEDFTKAGEFQAFKLDFNNLENSKLEFRMYWDMQTSIEIDKIVVSSNSNENIVVETSSSSSAQASSSSSEKVEANNSNNVIIIVAVVGGLVVVGLIGFYFLRKKK